MEYKYCGSEPKMKVDPTLNNQGRVPRVLQSELRRMLDQRKLGSSDVLDNGLIFQYELRRVPEPSNVIVAHPVRSRSVILLGAQFYKDCERNMIGSVDHLITFFGSTRVFVANVDDTIPIPKQKTVAPRQQSLLQ